MIEPGNARAGGQPPTRRRSCCRGFGEREGDVTTQRPLDKATSVLIEKGDTPRPQTGRACSRR